MGTGIPPLRSYNEKEIGELIQRATSLHEKAAGSSASNLTLEEIEHIATELGLPSEYVQAAALELEDRRYARKSTNFWGGPFFVDRARVVTEAMTEEQWEEIVLQLRRFFGTKGQIGQIGRAREWGHYTGEGPTGINFQKTEVTVRPGEGQTSIQIRKHFAGLAALYPIVLFVTVFLSLAAMNQFENGLTFGLGVTSIFGGLALVRTFVRSWARRQGEKLTRMTDLIQQTLSTSQGAEEVSTSDVLETQSDFVEIHEPYFAESSEHATRERSRPIR